jgi:hypothetical protein
MIWWEIPLVNRFESGKSYNFFLKKTGEKACYDVRKTDHS